MLVLATIDESSESWRVVPHASDFASAMGGDLLLLQLLAPASPRQSRQPEADDHAVDQRRAEIETEAARLDVEATVRVLRRERGEDVPSAIVRVAAESGASIIGMATNGAGLLSSAVRGSVAAGVMGKAALPLMLAGPRVRAPTFARPYHLVVTTDGSRAANSVLPSVREVLQDAPREHVRITLLRIYRPAFGDPSTRVALEDVRREMATFERRAPQGFPLTSEVRDDSGVHGTDQPIQEAADKLEASAIWMASHGHSLIRRALLGSVALSTVRNAAVPVIVTRADH